jgi:hypothetical protein
MFGNKTNGCLTFYYNSEELFNDVGILSAYMTKNLKNEDGSLLDAFNITEDEREVYNVCVKQALPIIYENLVKLTSRIDDAFAEVVVKESDADALNRTSGTYIEFNINDNGAYNKNVRTLINDTLYDCIKYGVLNEFYSICPNADLFRIANSKFAACLNNLNKRLFQLKKRSVASQIA